MAAVQLVFGWSGGRAMVSGLTVVRGGRDSEWATPRVALVEGPTGNRRIQPNGTATQIERSREPTEAQRFYHCAFFRAAMAHATRAHDDTLILSAKFGPVHPWEVVDPYSDGFQDLDGRELSAWAERAVRWLCEDWPEGSLDVWVYAQPRVVDALRREMRKVRRSWHLIDPFDGMSELAHTARIQWLKRQVASVAAVDPR